MKNILIAVLLSTLLALPSPAAKYTLNANTTDTINSISSLTGDPAKMVLVGNNALIRQSDDLGVTWTAVTSPVKGVTLTKAAYISPSTIYALANVTGANVNYLFKATNGIWANDTDSLGKNVTALRDIYFLDANKGYIVGDRFLLKSEFGDIKEPRIWKYKDGIFTLITNAPFYNYTAVTAYGSNVWLVATEIGLDKFSWNSYIYKSPDECLTFQAPITLKGVKVNAIQAVNADLAFWVGDGGNAGKIEAANTAIATGTTNNLNVVAAYNPTYVVMGGGSGDLRFYNGNTVTAMISGTTQNIRGITLAAPGLYTVAGDSGNAVADITPAPQTLSLSSRLEITAAPQGKTLTMVIKGQSLSPNSTVTVSGIGVVLKNYTFVNLDEINVEVEISTDAADGDRTLTFKDPFGGETSFALPLTINKEPTVIGASPAVGKLTRGSSSKRITILGSDFKANANYPPTLDFKRNNQAVAGLTYSNLTIVDSRTVTFDLNIADDVEPGTIDVIYTGYDLGTVAFQLDIDAALAAAGPQLSNLYFDGRPYGASFGTGPKFDVINAKPHIQIRMIDPDTINTNSIQLLDNNTPISTNSLRHQSYDSTTNIWSCDLAQALSEGPHTLKFQVTDALGNVGTLNCQVKVYAQIQLVEGTTPLATPTPVTGNTVRVAYALTRDTSGIDILVASPTGGLIVKKRFDLPTMGIKAGYGAGYNEVEIEIPSDLGRGIYPAKIISGNQVIGKFYLVK